MQFERQFSLTFEGASAEVGQVDFYDISRALIGFQRSLALTSHLVLNDEVITQATSLKRAQIVCSPPEEGSWKLVATLLAGAYYIGTAPSDTPLGHLAWSAYDYVVSESLGFNVDYDQTLGQQYDRLKSGQNEIPVLEQSRFDSVIEKCDHALKDVHRPIVGNETANTATITSLHGSKTTSLTGTFSGSTFDYMDKTIVSETKLSLYGRVTSYNSNTFSGRIFLNKLKRPVPFKLIGEGRSPEATAIIGASLLANIRHQYSQNLDVGFISVKAYENMSRSGRVKSVDITEVNK